MNILFQYYDDKKNYKIKANETIAFVRQIWKNKKQDKKIKLK